MEKCDSLYHIVNYFRESEKKNYKNIYKKRKYQCQQFFTYIDCLFNVLFLKIISVKNMSHLVFKSIYLQFLEI